jgi:pimeloyl-ACP methyl ester carboxylesterase
MAKRNWRAAFGFGAMALAISACGLAAAAAEDEPFARLGPPDAPIKLFYTDQGEGPPLLLIHGFGTNTFTWRHVAPDLTRDHRVITVDLKGFGKSDKPLDERYAAADQADLLAQMIEEQNLHDLTLVGHSYGGGIALLLALQDDDRVKGRIAKLVLLDTIAYPQTVPTFFKMLDMPMVSQIGVRAVPSSFQVEVALRIAYFDDDKIEAAEVDAYSEPLQTAAGKHAMIHSARQIVPPDLESISARYGSITLPTLILWCDHDRIVPLDVGLKLRRTMPNSKLRIISECGHMPQEEQPASVLSQIRLFLADKPSK